MVLEYSLEVTNLTKHIEFEKGIQIEMLEVLQNDEAKAVAVVAITEGTMPEGFIYLKTAFFEQYGADSENEEASNFSIVAVTPEGEVDVTNKCHVVLFEDDLIAVRESIKQQGVTGGIGSAEDLGVLVIN